MHTILVAGATGTIGSLVVRELASRPVAVRALVRDPVRATTMLGDVELAVGDADDDASIRRAMVGVDRLFLTVADGPDKVARETALVDVAAESGVELIVKLSAQHADAHPELPAFGWHQAIEAHLLASGAPAAILRPSFFMTNLLMVAAGVAHTGTLHAPTAHGKVAMIHPADVGAVAAEVLSTDGHTGRTYELTGPDAITFTDVADALAVATGRPVDYVDLTPEEAAPRFAADGIPDWLGRQLAGVFGLLRAGELAQTTDAVRAITGRVPSGIDTFAREHADAFQP